MPLHAPPCLYKLFSTFPHREEITPLLLFAASNKTSRGLWTPLDEVETPALSGRGQNRFPRGGRMNGRLSSGIDKKQSYGGQLVRRAGVNPSSSHVTLSRLNLAEPQNSLLKRRLGLAHGQCCSQALPDQHSKSAEACCALGCT